MFSVTIVSFGQKKIKKLEVKETGYHVKMNFKPIVDEFNYNGITIKITPVSPEKLNAFFLKESVLNGKFEYAHYEKSRSSYFLKRKKKAREKSDYEFLLEGALWLIENDKVSQSEYDELVKQITYKYDKIAGEQMYSTNRIISSNPYYINDAYLSVFQIEFTNPTDKHVIFDQNITVENGSAIYTPLSAYFIISELQRNNLMNVDKALILERHNLPEKLVIPPNSSFKKLFAIVPIEFNTDELSVSISNTDKKFKWEIIIDENSINERYTFYEFDVYWRYPGYISTLGLTFNILHNVESSVFLVDNDLFISEDSLNREFEIFTLSLYSDKLYYGRNTNVKGADYLDKIKNKREIIYLESELIESLKKKEKQ